MDVGKVAVTDNLGLRIALLQAPEEEPKGSLLLGCAGVGFASLVIQAAYVADADGMFVVVSDMGSGLALRTTCLDGAILQDYPVVAAAGPSLGTVTMVEVGDGPLLTLPGGGTVDYDVQHLLHGFHLFHGA